LIETWGTDKRRDAKGKPRRGAGHASLSTTQRYIQGDSAAKRRVVDM